MTVQEVITGVIKKTGMKPIPIEQTCDKLIIGNKNMEVTKIGSTFMATVDVIKEAAEQEINFIITHEPTWFNGIDDTKWLENDPVYQEKKKLIEKHQIAIWRFHDYMHMGKEDEIYNGFEEESGWKKYRFFYGEGKEFIDRFGGCYEIPETSLEELCKFFKNRFGMEIIQIVGNSQMSVKRVGVLVGGGSLGLGTESLPMCLMREQNLDLIICGDITEWTLSAYVRDAAQLGMNKGMLVLGHERSEEPGMKHLPGWMESITGGIPVVFLDAKEPFGYR